MTQHKLTVYASGSAADRDLRLVPGRSRATETHLPGETPD